jgi:diguanylate cyclase (GGDEF)-like protein
MGERTLDILLVEDSRTFAQMIKQMMASGTAMRCRVTHVERLNDVAGRIAAQTFDVVLLDLTLPDSHGLDTLTGTLAQAEGIPIIVVTGLDDEGMAMTAVHQGAQDYLLKGEINYTLLMRSMRYAIERHRLLAEVRSLSVVDELTGLYNRRGFLTLAPQQLKIADRTRSGLVLLFADLDKMKTINDTWGHEEGDQALRDTANLLRATFRESDIIARIGGDEFVVLAATTSPRDADTLIARLQQQVAAHNARTARGYALSISAGTVAYDPQQPCGIRDLLARADTLMYDQKRAKRA